MTADDDEFRIRYGPWALLAGASEGVGASLARALAARGVHVVLLARRQSALDDVAASITAPGVEVRTVAVDLTAADAVARIRAATDDIDIGLLAYCAGADPNYRAFLDQSVDDALAMVQRNCAVPVQLCHHYGGPMAARGRGGIVFVGSGAGLVGGPNVATYAATKAFDMLLAESLWAELHGRGVDVLGLILGVTDTPALRRLLAQREVLASADDDSPIPGAVSADDTAEEALANLANGPTHFVGDMLRDGAPTLLALPRNDAVRMMIDIAGGVMGPTEEAAR